MRSAMYCAAALVLGLCAALPTRGAIVTVDNDNTANAAGNTFSIVSGSWATTNAGTEKFGADYLFKSAGTGSAEVKWQPTIPAAGDYHVRVWYTAFSNRANNSPYTVDYDGGSSTVLVNQQINGETWVDIGTFPFAVGTSGAVRLSDAANGLVIADAVQLVSVPEPSSLPLAVAVAALALRRGLRR